MREKIARSRSSDFGTSRRWLSSVRESSIVPRVPQIPRIHAAVPLEVRGRREPAANSQRHGPNDARVVGPHVRHEFAQQSPSPLGSPDTTQSTTTMDLRAQELWETVLNNVDVAIRNLGHVLGTEEGREFVYALGPREAGLCLELLDRVSLYLPLSLHSLENVVGFSGPPPRRKFEECIPPHIDHVGRQTWAASQFARNRV